MMNFGPFAMLFGFVVVLLGVIVALRFVIGTGGNAIGPSRGHGSHGMRLEAPREQSDPLDIVRDRYARGEIDHDDLERYLDNLIPPGRPSSPGDQARGRP